MFSEWKGPRMPQTGAAVAGCSSAPGGLLYFYPLPLLSPGSYSSSQSIHPAFLHHSWATCVRMYMHACLLSCVSHRSLLWGPTAILGRCLGPSSQLYCLHLAWWMASCLISPSACNLKWFPGASQCLQLWSLSSASSLSASFYTHTHRAETLQTEAHNYIQIILFWMYSSKTTCTRMKTMHWL